MIHLLMSPRTARTVRGLIGAIAGVAADAVRSVIAPATLVEQPAPAVETEAPAVVEAPDPTDLFADDELPAVEDIARAALGYDLAADSARSADRAKRKHRKLLDRLPAGTYGAWLVRRVASSRQTVDLEKVRAIFEQHGLGDVPMRDNAPSLRVERIVTAADVEVLTEAAA
ncbi:hypothetical protein [Streptomyces sp. NBC_00151]|uniref:hypothetical protein n=1 Tax=Streptomyces sp. NBC_00151 TaxID=2975669 RepID=UPI002DD7E8EE|nr:hypothetical protein [Streptomyces sp. NBC_00151]WRZ41896.1 hypothetical protein OG915_29960 [Streptomyces sp. NBC_00151]